MKHLKATTEQNNSLKVFTINNHLANKQVGLAPYIHLHMQIHVHQQQIHVHKIALNLVRNNSSTKGYEHYINTANVW